MELFTWGTLTKRCKLAVVILLFVLGALTVPRTKGFISLELSPVAEHHVAGLNSNMPYAAGFYVIADNLTVREQVNATAVTVSFPSTNTTLWQSDSWLGGGMFVQGQDKAYRNVDYGFYMMLVLDASGKLFIDLGLHQTEEATLPIQTCMFTLVYAYTWQIGGINKSTPITLIQSWDTNGSLNYSISISGQEEELIDVNVIRMPNCQNMIQTFYAGNVIDDPFPFSRYISYFQFGVISNQAITNPYWSVNVEKPAMLRTTGWVLVDKAWSLEGDHSYLDHDLMWGGAPYAGVELHYYQHPLQNPYEIVFSYSGTRSTAGRVLWDVSSTNSNATVSFTSQNQALTELSRQFFPIIIIALGAAILLPFLFARHRRKLMAAIK
jgi:hypothetical protein